jgi:membrane protein required for colicin V production
MTGVDLAIIVIVGASTLFGLWRGFIVEIATILGAVAGLGVASLEYVDLRRVLAQVAPHSAWLTVVSYLLIFLVVWGAILLIARRVRLLVRLMMLGWLDRLGGAVVGFLQGALVVELLLYLGKRVPAGTLRHAVSDAQLTPTFQSFLPYLQHWFPHVTTNF